MRTKNPGKPGNKRTGIRLYTLSDTTGYIFMSMLHSTKPLFYRDKGTLFSIVLGLMRSEGLEGPASPAKSFLNKGHRLFVDNLYTELPTIFALLGMKTYTCGTVRKGKSFFPKPIMVASVSEVRHGSVQDRFLLVHSNVSFQFRGAKFERGDCIFVFSSHGNIVFVNWRDNKNVFICSSLPEILDHISTCKRTVLDKASNTFKRKEITRPLLVKEYTSCMFNVDRG